MERRPGFAVLALFAALLLVAAWPAHGCGCNDEEADDSPDCAQVSLLTPLLHYLVMLNLGF